MLNVIGDMLVWATAAVLFPFLLLPAAALIDGGNRLNGTLLWVLTLLLLTGGGIGFVILAPRLAAAPSPGKLALYAGAILVLALLVAGAGGPRRASLRLAPLLEALTRGAGRAAMWLVFAMAIMQFATVIMRYVFGINFLAMQESVTYMHGAVFLLAGGYALLTDSHVRVDIFYRVSSPQRQALIDFLGIYLFLFPVMLLILWTASPYVAGSWGVREGSAEASGIAGVFLLKSLIPAFALLMIAAGFTLAVKAGETLRGGR